MVIVVGSSRTREFVSLSSNTHDEGTAVLIALESSKVAWTFGSTVTGIGTITASRYRRSHWSVSTVHVLGIITAGLSEDKTCRTLLLNGYIVPTVNVVAARVWTGVLSPWRRTVLQKTTSGCGSICERFSC
uniref:Uncharacterized protein n=1 Tax=Cacopsylla melanoneura TaxID=428564 RepID=A0A8D8ZAU0_9HEMI